MKSQSQDKRVCFETIKELEVYKMNERTKRIKKVKVQITINSDNLIAFSYGNKILKTAYPCELQTNIDMFQNIEQIQNLEWQGEYGPTKRKSGKWIATWKGKQILGVGGYYQDEQKIGLWKQPIKNYWSQAKVYESGEYFEDQKCGRWNYIYKNQIIGGGSYDERGKVGKWVELVEGFYESQQVFYGEYKNGKKVGVWEIYCKGQYQTHFKSRGGGLYDEGGNGIKIGKWVELNEGFFSKNQVIHAGEYKNGNKIGIWNINFKDRYDTTIEQIGGGSYDEIGNGIKIGKWVEVDEDNQIIYCGEYSNGKRVGRWDMKFRADFCRQFRKFGGGQYDKRNENFKIGKWIELDEQFDEDNQIIHKGEYEKGKKVGRWDIEYRKNWSKQFSKMQKYNIKYVTNLSFYKYVSGGGIFKEAEKQGNWEILNNTYDLYFIKSNGEYKDGKKVGRWDIWLSKDENNERIGGGLYDGIGKEIKLGNWSEISYKDLYIIQKNGEYKDGKKDGVWVKMVRLIFKVEWKLNQRKEIIYQR